MPTRTLLRRGAVALAAVALAVLCLLPAPADAHSLGSSTIALRIESDDTAGATVSLALETLDQALGTSYATEADVSTYADDVIAYLDQHLSATGTDGTAWGETWTDARTEAVEGIQSFTAEVTFTPGTAGTGQLTLVYDAVIEAVADHQAVVVLTDSTGEISTVGVLDAGHTSLAITDGTTAATATDMVGFGIHHVLDGADHLLFLATLLLPAPLVVTAGRWQRGRGLGPTLRRVVHVVTAFTFGHSVTLIASALGWVSVPSRPVEVLIAVSIGISAVHAVRPLARRGEELIAGGFGLVHGLAFAGILADLGLRGTTSVLTLLAFNLGIELAQLATIALVFPSIHLLSGTRWYPAVRVGGALAAFAAAAGWAADRLELTANPLAGAETAATAHPWTVVGVLAAGAVAGWFLDRRSPAGRPAVASDSVDAGSPERSRFLEV